MIMCEIDSNAILSEAMNNRTSGEIVRAYQKLLKELRLCGMSPKKHVLDNEMSAEFKDAVRMNGMEYELVPKGQHQRNIAEKAIQTWKAHAISVFSGMDSKCPLYLWDLILPQIDWQINMLRQSNVTPKVSADAHLHGQHVFNRHPMAPLGIEIHSYIPPKPGKRRATRVITLARRGNTIGITFLSSPKLEESKALKPWRSNINTSPCQVSLRPMLWCKL